MQLSLVVIGKTVNPLVEKLIQEYGKRIVRYQKFAYVEIPALKKTAKLSQREVKEQEGLALLQHVKSQAHLVLLDDKGKQFSSVGFARHLADLFLYKGAQEIVFAVGGAFGFSEEVYARANEKLSLSTMTFPHQLVRVIFLEQLYRAFTIQRGEPYHHE